MHTIACTHTHAHTRACMHMCAHIHTHTHYKYMRYSGWVGGEKEMTNQHTVYILCRISKPVMWVKREIRGHMCYRSVRAKLSTLDSSNQTRVQKIPHCLGKRFVETCDYLDSITA